MTQNCVSRNVGTFGTAREMVNSASNRQPTSGSPFGKRSISDIYERYGSIYETIEKAEEIYDRYSNDSFYETFRKNHHREKRAFNLVIPTFVSNLPGIGICMDEFQGLV